MTSFATSRGTEMMVFRPKRELCLATLLLFGWWALFLLGLAVWAWRGFETHDTLQLAVIVIQLLFGTAWMWQFLFLTYEITESEVIVHTIPLRLTIRISDIFEVLPTRGSVLNLSFSRDALKIRFHRNKILGYSVVVAPRDKAQFVSALAARAPGLEFCEDGLKPTESPTIPSTA